jgi:hypothetical protein
MTALEEIKNTWNSQSHTGNSEQYEGTTFRQMVKGRVNKHNKTVLQYFWKSLLLQVLVYVMLGYVIASNRFDLLTMSVGIFAVLLNIPFTFLLLKNARRIIVGKKLKNNSENSFHNYVKDSHKMLKGFFRFKKLADLILIPLSSLIGVFLTFRLFIPGGVYAWPELAGFAFIITLLSCLKALTDENKKNFKEPLKNMESLLDEFKTNNL